MRRWIQPLHDVLGAQSQPGIIPRPGVAGARETIDHVGIHIFAVSGRVVAHRVEDDRRVILSHSDVEFSVLAVAVLAIGIGGLPVVVTEMGLREGDEHAHVVRGSEDFLETQVGTGFAVVVVRINKVDAKALEPLHALTGARIASVPRVDLSIVERHAREENAGAIQVKVPTVDPEFSEPEAYVVGDIDRPLLRVKKRHSQ